MFRAATPSILIGACLALSACSGEVSVGKKKDLTGEEVAKDLREEYAERESASQITLTALTCQEVEAEVDAPISCTGRNSKEIDLEFTGTVTSTDGDGLDYRWRISKALAPGALFERPLRPQVERALRREVRDVSCPTRVQVMANGRFQCTVELTAKARFIVDVRQTNSSGGFTWGIRRNSGSVDR